MELVNFPLTVPVEECVNEDCQTAGCNSGSWAPKFLNVKDALPYAIGNELTVHMMNRERLIIVVDKD